MTVIERKPRTCGREVCTSSACFCCSPPVPWDHDERNPAAHDEPKPDRMVAVSEIRGGA